MLNFPLPYKNELLYSTVARAGIHFAITSPKQLLDTVFNNRKVIATIDCPNHLQQILKLLPTSKYNLEDLIYQHTLFPLYAAFIQEDRRQRCINWMADISQGSTHLALGITASRVKQPKLLRYCPQCLSTQLTRYGELYWSRLWQVSGADCCLKHGTLINAKQQHKSYHRHNFIAADFNLCPLRTQSTASQNTINITTRVIELLNIPAEKSARYTQWGMYYKQLAKQANCVRGQQHINHEEIKSRVYNHWSKKWLHKHNLSDVDS